MARPKSDRPLLVATGKWLSALALALVVGAVSFGGGILWAHEKSIATIETEIRQVRSAAIDAKKERGDLRAALVTQNNNLIRIGTELRIKEMQALRFDFGEQR